jgi:Spy/CpxP family protein refolding chaperone
MGKKIGVLLIVLSVALNLAFIGTWATQAFAVRAGHGGHAGHAESHGAIWCPLHQKLGTSPEQWKQIEPGLLEFRKNALSICQEVGQKRQEMLDLIASAQPDREAIRAKQEEILAGQRKMQDLVVERLLAEKKALTPDQQKQLFDMIRQRGGCEGHGPMLMGTGSGQDGECCR